MNKKYELWLVPVVLLLLISACQKTQHQPERPQSRSQYQRIISLSPSTTEILFALGLGEKVVGVTRFCQYPPQARQITEVGGYLDPNYEAIAMLKPDVVILLPEQAHIQTWLQQLSINYFTVDNKTIDDILSGIAIIGDSCQAEIKADSMVTAIKQKIAHIKKITEPLPHPTLLLCIGRALGTGTLEDVYFAGRNTFYDEIIEAAGGKNAFKKEGIAYPSLSAEGIITLNPDIIVDLIAHIQETGLSESAILKDWETVSQVPAVKNKRLYLLTEDYVFIPGPRFILFLEDLAKMIQPEIEP